MKKLLNEFKEFAFKGNVLDMAVGVIIGGAMTSVVSALVDLVLGLISGIIHIPENLSSATFKIGELSIPYGALLFAVINFLILALCVFFIVKAINTAKEKMTKKEKNEEKKEPEKPEDIVLLEEIRDLLKDKKEE